MIVLGPIEHSKSAILNHFEEVEEDKKWIYIKFLSNSFIDQNRGNLNSLSLQNVKFSQNITVTNIKALGSQQFQFLVGKIGVHNIYALSWGGVLNVIDEFGIVQLTQIKLLLLRSSYCCYYFVTGRATLHDM